MKPAPAITREQVREFEMLQSRCVESLMRPVGDIPGNEQGYAYYEKQCGDSLVRAALSTNPYARHFCAAYGLTREMDPATLAQVIAFFRDRGVAPRIRIVPDGFTKEKAALLASYGLRHFGFHTVMWSPLPLDLEPIPSNIRVQHVTEPAEFDLAMDVSLAGWRVPCNADSPIKKLRRCWRTLPQHRTYLAYLDDKPAGHAMLYLDGRSAYVESASVIPEFRGRGVHTALIRRRIADAIAQACSIVVGGADFESQSRKNQMRCGLQIGYLAALWE